MKLVTNKEDLQARLSNCKPARIAVAFVGSDWQRYVDAKALREIIVSPTIGSNPKAIFELVNALGWDNVHFLDNLHAKIYVGSNCALLGSCNLSKNGFSDYGLVEAAVFLDDQGELEALNSYIDRISQLAKVAYPSEAHKKERLSKLLIDWSKGVSAGVLADEMDAPSVVNFSQGLERIHISWYQPEDIEYNEEKIASDLPHTAGIDLDSYFADALEFHEDDDLRAGDWVLCWRANNDGRPRLNAEVSWMYVHHVISDGTKDSSYTKLAGEAKGMKKCSPPFELDRSTQDLIKRLIGSGDFPELISEGDEDWNLGRADRVTQEFLRRLVVVAQQGAAGVASNAPELRR